MGSLVRREKKTRSSTAPREEDAGRKTSRMAKLSDPRGWGWEQKVRIELELTDSLPLQLSCVDRGCVLEGEIISSRISRVSRKDSENYSSLISFHFISVCLS